VSRLSPALALRVDRLARRAHGFHRWAHHPLCTRYAPELVRLGRRTRVCRGCLLAAAGIAAGLAAGLAAPALPAPLALAAAGLVALAAPWATRRRAPGATGRRAAKLLTRFVPSALAGVGVAQLGAGTPSGFAAAALALAGVAALVSRYRRRGPDRGACEGCPAGPPSATCAGFARQVSRERALQRLAARWIAAEVAPCRSAADDPPVEPPGGGCAVHLSYGTVSLGRRPR
jgi:hypothetical protein